MTNETAQTIYTYRPELFDAKDIDAAKRVILTNEGPGKSTEIRWSQETPYMGELIGQQLQITPGALILDYGCGVGRVAKELIEVYKCQVIGVDISADMRRLAADYVNSSRFFAVSPEQLDWMVDKGLRADAAIAVWVLQHCFNPAGDIARIRSTVRPDGRFFVANMNKRAVPATLSQTSALEWVSDGVNVRELLEASFDTMAAGDIDPTRCPPATKSAATYWVTLKPRG